MDVPEDVDADGVHAKSLAHLDAVFPIGTRYARIMHFGSLHDERLSVEEESVFACFKCACMLLRAGRRRDKCRSEKRQHH